MIGRHPRTRWSRRRCRDDSLGHQGARRRRQHIGRQLVVGRIEIGQRIRETAPAVSARVGKDANRKVKMGPTAVACVIGLANHAAGLAVREVGTVAVTRDQLATAIEDGGV